MIIQDFKRLRDLADIECLKRANENPPPDWNQVFARLVEDHVYRETVAEFEATAADLEKAAAAIRFVVADLKEWKAEDDRSDDA